MDLRYPYTLPPLPYGYDELCPAIGEETLCFHHDKHLRSYVEQLNRALEDCEAGRSKTLEELLRDLDSLPAQDRVPVGRSAGGVYNHLLYFAGLSPSGGGEPSGALAEAIQRDFGSFFAWKRQMAEAARTLFGSGYAWLVSDREGALSLLALPNQDCPSLWVCAPCSVWTCGSTPTIWTCATAGATTWSAGSPCSPGPWPRPAIPPPGSAKAPGTYVVPGASIKPPWEWGR